MSTPSTAAPHDVTTTPHDIDLTHVRWRKSSYSGGANDCVEIAELGMFVAVRDSKDVRRQPLIFSRQAMRPLVRGIASRQPVSVEVEHATARGSTPWPPRTKAADRSADTLLHIVKRCTCGAARS
ncbi:DUF397 domain-containing protein [Streptomyces sp. NPDC001093]|uniref:DUF397 domain-containing protein n=1 Tax=Streptomyces sp. NPDC001093 TaxID=3154376 RepID=UPI00332D8DF5